MSQNYPIQLKPNKLAHQLIKLWGWKCSFKGLPGPHGVIIFYPHTSNWDFCIGILAKWAMGLEFKFLAKHTLFQIPILALGCKALVAYQLFVTVHKVM
jgi:lauroyl/myristoyl acyltransferase